MLSIHLPNSERTHVPRPSQIDEQRKQLMPIVCQVFSELGYHRTTTAELARRCKVRENILYRLWRDKKAMFLAAIDNIFQSRVERWGQILAERPTMEQAAKALVAYEARHQGEFGFYRVVFTALVEADDPEIRAAITNMYRRFHERIRKLVDTSREGARKRPRLDAEETAWRPSPTSSASWNWPGPGNAKTCSLKPPSIWSKETDGSFSFYLPFM
jgi:AcrR family transcriptional regulator